MRVKAFKTHLIEEGESLLTLLDRYLPPLEEGSIIAITSKIVSLCEGRVVPKTSDTQKLDLIQQECEAFLNTDSNNSHGICLTITNGLLIPTAGIDESNIKEAYILYPKECEETASTIWNHLRKRDKLKDLGVIITDSRTTPMRRGVTGMALSWCGFVPLYSYIGKPDVHGNPLCVTQTNILDALATSAVFVMGEGNEQTPLAVIKDAPKIEFQSRPPTQTERDSIKISLTEDLYAPLLNSDKWVWRDQ